MKKLPSPPPPPPQEMSPKEKFAPWKKNCFKDTKYDQFFYYPESMCVKCKVREINLGSFNHLWKTTPLPPQKCDITLLIEPFLVQRPKLRPVGNTSQQGSFLGPYKNVRSTSVPWTWSLHNWWPAGELRLYSEAEFMNIQFCWGFWA